MVFEKGYYVNFYFYPLGVMVKLELRNEDIGNSQTIYLNIYQKNLYQMIVILSVSFY